MILKDKTVTDKITGRAILIIHQNHELKEQTNQPHTLHLLPNDTPVYCIYHRMVVLKSTSHNVSVQVGQGGKTNGEFPLLM